ncbi:MAG: amidase [Actinomycetia bacterium]|nr:amidase [Actinomycetes bacterium]MCP4962038.1 amidase [Actinomycetes bacterium]
MQIPDATALAELVRDGKASPAELVDEAITRIESTNPTINAVIHPRFEAARDEAAGGLVDGPFRGVPMLVKDLNCAIAGEPHHMGCKALKEAGFIAPIDSFLYRRFQKLGLVTLGRTNTPEFGSTITTEPEAYGPSRNPWNTDHSTGGSSGGSAAAVAAGLVPIAHANDGGGSIRIPASECGLVGLKPTRGRVSQGPDIGEAWAGSTIDGVVTRSVRDTATALDGISGPEPGDPYYAAPPLRPFASEVGVDPGRLKIGIAPTAPHGTSHDECIAAVEAAGSLLEDLGHAVEIAQPAALSEEALTENFLTVLAASTAADFHNLAAAIGRPLEADDVEPGNWFFAEMGRAVTGEQYLLSVQWTHAWQRRMASWWAHDGFDILVTPTLAVPPPPIGWLSDPELGFGRVQEIMLFTAQFNVTGQPAVSLPLHQTADGLPVGVQFVGPYAGEDLLIRLASQLEDAAPWADRIPPLWAAG